MKGGKGFLVWVLGAVMLTAAASASATPSKFPTDENEITSFAGDQDNLPVGPSVTVAQAVNAARNMPTVRTAFAEFEHRGYLRRASSDTAVFLYSPGVTFVTLAWNKPGLVLPAGSAGAPLVLVATAVDPATGMPATTCTAGIMIADTLHRVVFSGDSLPALRTSDPSFDIVTGEAGGGEAGEDPGPILKRPPSSSTNWFTNPNSKFNRWLGCAGWNALACFAIVLRVRFVPMIMVAFATNPELLVSAVAICQVGAAIGCISALVGNHQ